MQQIFHRISFTETEVFHCLQDRHIISLHSQEYGYIQF